MGSLHETNPSVWAITAPEDAGFEPLTTTATADVVVVGGGITGLSAALALVEAGLEVVVLEAGRVCSGVTAYTTAKVTSLHGLTYAGLAKSFGDDVARAYGEANQAGIERIAQWIDQYGIECDFSRRAAFTYTTSTERVAAISEEVEVAQRLGLPASFTTATDLPFDVAGAVRFDDQAQFHPRDYCLGLARAIAGRGGRVHERTRVVDVDEGSPCTVRTATDAEITAGHIVLATHLPFLDRGGFFAKCHPERSYAIAVRLEAGAAAPRGMYLSADQPSRSVRAALGDGVVIIGGEGHKTGQDPDTPARYSALETWAAATFPVASVEAKWSAQDHMPVDGLPFVGRQLPRSKVFVATGFKKWGMTNGTAAGVMIAREISGWENPWRPAFDATRVRAPFTSADFYKENAGVARHFVGDRLARNEAPTCTHLGCKLAKNTAEQTWDCPCHGSRFTLDGKVIEGPAVRDLAREEVE